MKHLRISLILAALISAASASAIRAQQSQPPSPRIVDLKASDAILLKATYFAAGKPGPGVLLFHQSNRTRLLTAGTVLGLIGARQAGRAMRSLLFQVPPLNVAVLAAGACVTAAVCLAACLLPSQRAAQISPMEALAEE